MFFAVQPGPVLIACGFKHETWNLQKATCFQRSCSMLNGQKATPAGTYKKYQFRS